MNPLILIKKIYLIAIGYISSLLAYFLPIRDLTLTLLILFVISFALGLYHSIRHDNENLDKSKFFRAFIEVAVYVTILASFFTIGDKMHSKDFVVKTIEVITWGLIWLYISNIFKNLRRLMPWAKGIMWIYYILNLEFIKKVPEWKQFQEQENKDK